jgi:hypothetical protein
VRGRGFATEWRGVGMEGAVVLEFPRLAGYAVNAQVIASPDPAPLSCRAATTVMRWRRVWWKRCAARLGCPPLRLGSSPSSTQSPSGRLTD